MIAPGTRLGPYEIIGPLGAGGMGEVYKARDPRLNRVIALKLLPATATADGERRERFEREAQAIAALNHPNIVTIHSVEEVDGQFFLTMELVEGRSLADAIHGSGMPLDRFLKIAIQIADAVAAAHQKGITHRDLKPANVMLGEGEHDGRVKVLDFGLAKLAEAPAAAAGATTLPTAPITGEGRILGTVAYMSPEQAEGKPIDARSDLFSLGVMFYEMATGTRPFAGDTSMSIISSIIKDTPKSVTDLNPVLPRDLGRIIRRALVKDPTRRYQTAADLRNDLEELKTSIESGELPASTPRSGARRWGLAVVAGIVVVALAAGIYILKSRSAQPSTSAATTASIQDLQLTQLTTSGDADRPVISPDGKYVAYIKNSTVAVGSSVWIRQVATSSNVQIVPPEPGVGHWGLTVTPDGSFVDYIRQAAGRPGQERELWRVSFIGGAPKKLIENVGTPIGWSPDGRHMAFVRADGTRGSSAVIVADADGGNPRVLVVRQMPSRFDWLGMVSRPSVRPAWSPDGRVIALPGSLANGRDEIVFVDSATGSEHAVTVPTTVFGIDWLDTVSLVVNQAAEPGASQQLWRLAYPSGVPARLTNDLSNYMGVSVTAARDSLVTARLDRRMTMSVSDGAGGHAKEVVAPVPSSSRAAETVAWAGDHVLFTSTVSGHPVISSVGQDGGTPQEVVDQAGMPTATSDGRTIVFISADPARRGLWKITDGGRPVQVTAVSNGWFSVTPDGRHVVFVGSSAGDQSVWIVSIDGGAPTQVTSRYAEGLALSPDGKSVTFATVDAEKHGVLMICDLPACSSPRSMPVPGNMRGPARWMPDSRRLAYVAGTPGNLWVLPADGTPSQQLTHFTDDRTIRDYAWSRDGQRLAIVRATTSNDIVLFKGLKK